MEKIVRLIGVIFLLLFLSGSSGCPSKPPPPLPATPLFYQHLSKGKSAEAKKDLAQALDFYNLALMAAPRKSNEQVEAHQSVLRVQRMMKKAKEYCQEYKALIKAGKHSEAERALKQMRQIWTFYSECNLSLPPTPTLQPVDHYRILKEKPVIHKIRRGDIISKLCQKYYGQTGNYKLVRIITDYNKIDAKSLVSGQKIKFPSIQLKGDIYRPQEPGAQPIPAPTIASKLTPTPTPMIAPKLTTPTPSPQPTITPVPTVEPVSDFNRATELFRKGQYADAISTLNNAPDTSPEKEDSWRLLVQCHFRLAQISMEKAHYREALDTFHKALKICQRLQGSDLPPECGQIVDLVKKCDAQVKIEVIKEHLGKGKQLLNASHIDSAIAEFEKVLAVEPQHKDALEYLYLTHFRKANHLWKNKAYQQALEEFMTAWEYNQNCEECQVGINKIKGVLYRKAKALERRLLEPNAPTIKIFQEQINYYTIINQIDPQYEDVVVLLERVRKRKKALERINLQQPESPK